MKKFWVVLGLFFGLSFYAQENRFVKIDSFLNYMYQNQKFRGGIAISEENKVIFYKNYGFLDASEKQKANKNTKYKIGSVTKTFTATLIMQLIEERKLRLEANLVRYFPKLTNAEKITLKDLLHHRSGIMDYINADTSVLPYLAKGMPKDELLAKICAYPSVFEPNSKYEYSNSNYYLLGLIIEKVTKKTYAENISERIVKPLHLENTYYPKNSIDTQINETYSFTYNGKSWDNYSAWDMGIPFSSGALVSTPSDLAIFLDALFTPNVLLKETSIEQMKAIEQGYGKGLAPIPFGDRIFLGHGGKIEQFNSIVMHYEPENLSISIIANGLDYTYNDILIAVLSMYYKMPFAFPVFDTLSIDSAVLESYAGLYSSSKIPLKIRIFIDNGKLMAQATGQGAFPLTPQSETSFQFTQAGIQMDFSSGAFVLKQNGFQFDFTKDTE